MEEGYLALRWNNHNIIFTKILNLLREQEAYTDVSLACGGRFFPAHKFVLSTCSDYFKEMFAKTPCKHPVVFMKDVTGQDMESLLDFMYKGEVHVPQSELGSLLRTAEGLQVKGLAVPDDAVRASGLPLGSSSPCFTPSVPSSGSLSNLSTEAPSSTQARNALSGTSFPVKRKRQLDLSRKEEPPKLTPRPEVSSGHVGGRNNSSVFRNEKGTKTRLSGMPELKRIKVGGVNQAPKLVRNNNIHATAPSATDGVSDTYNDVGDRKDVILPNDEENGKDRNLIKDVKEEVEARPDQEADPTFAPENGDDKNEKNSLPDEEEELEYEEDEEEEEEGPEENSSAILPSEGDENSSLPNSEISTAELLQVDLSEDGTQFIIAPGGIGAEASRVSSAAEEEVSEGPKKPFVCLLCGHTFTRRDNLANHLKTHTGDRPYMCQYCHKCFSRKDYLKQHERIHTGEKPYPCEICSRAFTRKEGLTDHMRCHSDFKAFACETCGKSFKQKCGLRFHKRNYRH